MGLGLIDARARVQRKAAQKFGGALGAFAGALQCFKRNGAVAARHRQPVFGRQYFARRARALRHARHQRFDARAADGKPRARKRRQPANMLIDRGGGF